jgi:3-hydroxyacyl-CoA dehydrogenase
MNYSERLEKVAVLGAAGKMGSGIVLLSALEMADLRLEAGPSAPEFILHAIDVSEAALGGLLKYLRDQARRAAEKKTVWLRKAYEGRADLVENEEIIRQYIEDVLAVVRPSTRLEAAYDARLVFEAVNENPDLKVRLLSLVKTHGRADAWFLTNTSSIPISELDGRVGLEGRIIGFHFYNPPAVQKLVELIRAASTVPELAAFAGEFAKKLRKTVVPSHDVAGFIGNGHFMRDALYAASEVDRLAGEFGFTDSVYMINRVSQDWLIRPMGIFQLIDYVGLDVCQSILGVMSERLPTSGLASPLIDRLLSLGVKGGQFADGSQKDGFLKYEKGRPAGVFDPEKKAYTPFAELAPRSDKRLGAPPAAFKPWKSVMQVADRGTYLESYFRELKTLDTLGADLAKRYGRKSKEIGLQLVKDGVAGREEDVNTVLLTGFYHAYGPINAFFDGEENL